jgi:hypothetical protein
MQRAGLVTRDSLRNFLRIRGYAVARAAQECKTLA